MNCTRQAQAQISSGFQSDRPLQYAPEDPWTRSRLFKAQTKHYGFGYNCDGEECKRNSPYICWKNNSENDLPARKGWRQRLSQTAAEVKQRIADGNCVKCEQADPCLRCEQRKCGGCCDCQSSSRVEFASGPMDDIERIAHESLVPQPPYEEIDIVSTETMSTNADRISRPQRRSLLPESKSIHQVTAPARVAGLESLDIRVK